MRPSIKFCGMTRAQDIDCAVQLGVEEIGLVFAGNKRNIDLQTALQLARQVHGKALITGLFMNHDALTVTHILQQLKLDRLQFHGSETAAYCAAFGRPWIKAVAAGDGQNLAQTLQYWAEFQSQGLQAVLLDAHASGQLGGQGTAFDWSRIPQQRPLPIYLAGGLTAANVAAAIIQVQPETVDVSSGIETRPGIKCPEKMRAFVNEVRNVFAESQSQHVKV